MTHTRRASGRGHVFPPGNPRHDEKLAEMDRLLEIVTQLKDELKERLDAEYEQPRLLDVPRRAEYR